MWQRQRHLVNEWLETLVWPELELVNCCQKTWGDGPFGREKAFYGHDNANRNALTTAGTARMLEAVMTGSGCPPLRAVACVLCCSAPSIRISVVLIQRTRWMDFWVKAFLRE